jgi:hypothetical protein
VNVGLWGTTIGGSPPTTLGGDPRGLPRPPGGGGRGDGGEIGFERGAPAPSTGSADGVDLIAQLGAICRHGWAGPSTGDTVLGSRAVWPSRRGGVVAISSHRELEKLVTTHWHVLETTWRTSTGSSSTREPFEPAMRTSRPSSTRERSPARPRAPTRRPR